jgi:SAM-dependent methyltransferase
MRQSAATLEAFYATRLGRAAATMVSQRLIDLWGPCAGENVLGIGFPAPLLPLWQTTARACIGVLPEDIGISAYMSSRGGAITIAPEHRLPFGDGTFDRIFLLHALEEADSPRLLMREAWRVLAPEGRIIIAAANRKSFWSINEAEAFGHGRPWTRKQLITFLNDSLFQVTASTTAVHMPPLNWRLITSAAKSWERVGELVTPALGGVVLVEAVKRLYAKPGGSAAATVTKAVKASNNAPALPRNEAKQRQIKD